jgi:hypothetical protein
MSYNQMHRDLQVPLQKIKRAISVTLICATCGLFSRSRSRGARRRPAQVTRAIVMLNVPQQFGHLPRCLQRAQRRSTSGESEAMGRQLIALFPTSNKGPHIMTSRDSRDSATS